MIAYQTAVAVHKITRANLPTYLANKMKIKTQNMHLRGRLGSIGQPEHSLSIAREGSIFRGVQIVNKLDEVLKNEPKVENFKVGFRKWVRDKIQVKPSSKFSNFTRRQQSLQRNLPLNRIQQPQINQGQNSIRNYFHPI